MQRLEEDVGYMDTESWKPFRTKFEKRDSWIACIITGGNMAGI